MAPASIARACARSQRDRLQRGSRSFSTCSSSSASPSSRMNSRSPRSDSTAAGKSSDQPPLMVLKVGTSTLISSDSSGQRVNLATVAKFVELIAELRQKGYRVVLVSSGAVGMGCIKLGLSEKPKSIRTKQAVAAAGQSQIMRMYEDLFMTMKIHVAQLLISQSDFMEKDHWSNVKHTIFECLNLGVVPIINENDSTNTQELRFGDNDNLAALTAVQLEADGLFLFTDVDYLYTANPRVDPTATALRVVPEPWSLQVDTRAEGSGLGTGGMETKIAAARCASAAGIPCGLINGQHPHRIHSFIESGILSGEAPKEGAQTPEGTFFMAMGSAQAVDDTDRWILSLPTAGEVEVDDSAARALAENEPLLPAGIKGLQGSFVRDEAAKIMHRGTEIGRAIVNFDAEELLQIQGHSPNEYEDILGYATCTEACHHESVILTTDPESLKAMGEQLSEGPILGA